MENVVNMGHNSRVPKMKKLMAKAGEGVAQWREAMAELAVEMAEARKEHASNQAFSAWLTEHEIGFFNDDDRAAMIKIGADPEVAKIVFEQTNRLSPQHIVRSGELATVKEMCVRHVTKTTESHSEPEEMPEEAPEMAEEQNKPEEIQPDPQSAEIDDDNLVDALFTFFKKERSSGGLVSSTSINKVAPEGAGGMKGELRARILEAVKRGDWRYNGIGPAHKYFDLRMAWPFLPETFTDKIGSRLKTAAAVMKEAERLDELNRLCQEDEAGWEPVEKRWGITFVRNRADAFQIGQKAINWWSGGEFVNPTVMAIQAQTQRREEKKAEAMKHEKVVVFFDQVIFDPTDAKDVETFDKNVLEGATWLADLLIRNLDDGKHHPKGVGRTLNFLAKEIEHAGDAEKIGAILRRVSSAMFQCPPTAKVPDYLPKLPTRPTNFADD